jgi:hypothetical protein
MQRKIEVIGIRRDPPNWRLYVLALIALARQLQEEELAEQPDVTGKPKEDGDV